ncbi:MAG: hypothetical protein H7249_01300 [Chitinophagaceae bacterium]|nr:hypothetical protein [Oligoflexus sp.]
MPNLPKTISAAMVMSSLMIVACADKKNFAANVTPATTPSGAESSNSTIAGSDAPDQSPSTTSSPTTPSTTESSSLFNDCAGNTNNKFVADVYAIPGAQQKNDFSLKTFTYGSPIKQVCIHQLDIPLRPFSEGFPGLDSFIEWFLLDINFKLRVDAPGTYKFTMDSDDGSIITIDGNEVLNIDGLRNGTRHVIAEGSIALTEGTHKVRVQYFQGPKFDIALQLKWQPPTAPAPLDLPLNVVSRP